MGARGWASRTEEVLPSTFVATETVAAAAVAPPAATPKARLLLERAGAAADPLHVQSNPPAAHRSRENPAFMHLVQGVGRVQTFEHEQSSPKLAHCAIVAPITEMHLSHCAPRPPLHVDALPLPPHEAQHSSASRLPLRLALLKTLPRSAAQP